MPERVHGLDELRGLAICGMILHHTTYDLILLLGIGSTILYSPAGKLAQILIASTFILIAGISSRFSRNNRKRGLTCLGFAMLLTLITAVVTPEQIILFGVLHFLGTAMLLYHLTANFWNKCNRKILFVISFFLFLSTLIFFPTFTLPPVLHRPPFALSLFILGIRDPSLQIVSADYFPLIPWFFLFLAGTALGVPIRNGKAPAVLYRSHLPLFARIGKHSLLIYLVHQPIVYGLILLLSRLTSA